MIKRKIKAKDLAIGMNFIYQPRKGKYRISKIWDIVYYNATGTGQDRLKIYFNNMPSRTAKEDRIFEIFVDSPICIPRTKTESSRLKAYFENLESYKIGSTICKCGTIIPKGSIWHYCE